MEDKNKQFPMWAIILIDLVAAAAMATIVAWTVTARYEIEKDEPDLEIHPPIVTDTPEWMIETPKINLPAQADRAIELAAVVETAEQDSVEESEEYSEPEPVAIDYAAMVDRDIWEWSAVSMAKTLYGEAPYCSKAEQAAVYWCILDRVDDQTVFAGQDTPGAVVSAENQFSGYSSAHPFVPEYYELAFDVIGRWLAEKDGAEDVGRVLPKEYLYFIGDGVRNYFTTQELGQGEVWDWSLPNPYEEDMEHA